MNYAEHIVQRLLVVEHVDVDDTPARLGKALESIGVEIEWSDEWASCDECSKLVRTSADSHGWQPSYKQDEDGIRCVECIEEDPVGYLQSLEGNASTANTFDSIDPADHGYVLAKDEYEHGFHRGQDASPQLVAKALEAQGITRYLFQIDDDDVGQFDMSFSVYVHSDEAELLDRAKLDEAETDGPSVSGAMERGLREASAKLAQLEGEGVRYARVTPDGVEEARIVPPEEFARGIGRTE